MYLAIDIGGSKTLFALFSHNGRMVKRLKFKTNSEDPAAFFRTFNRQLLTFFPAKKSRIPTISCTAVAIAGSCDPSYSSISHPSAGTLPSTSGRPLRYGNLSWKNYPVAPTIEACIKNLFKLNRVKLPKSAPKLSIYGPTDTCCPIYIANDAALATLYEAKYFKGKSIYLTYSTGIGGGIMQDGKLLPESHTFEPGHPQYIWKSQRLKYEHIASSRAIGTTYRTLVTKITGQAALQDIALRVSTGLADIIRTERPDRLIIGGALGTRLRYFKKYLTPILAVSLNCSPQDLPKIIPAKAPLDSTIYGCYLYAKQKDR